MPGRSGKIYSKKFCNKRKVTSQSGVGDGLRVPRRPSGTARRWGAPGGRLGPLDLLSGSTWAWNFPNFAKTLKIKLLLMFVMFPYRNTYLFLFCSCWCLKPDCNMFFVSCCVYHIYINIVRISCHVMLVSAHSQLEVWCLQNY